jgi:hypothetical protein
MMAGAPMADELTSAKPARAAVDFPTNSRLESKALICMYTLFHGYNFELR